MAECFARLPDALRSKSGGRRNGTVRDCCLEGPSFDKHGNLLCVDITNGRILRLDREAKFSVVAEYEGNPNGLKIHRDGRIFVADHRRGLMLVDVESGSVTEHCPTAFGEPFRGLNDLIFASNGDLYLTDQGQSGMDRPDGRLYRRYADGRLQLLLDNVPSPNGLALTADEKTLYMAVTRANAVWRVPLTLHATGEVGRVGVFINLSGGTGPDGLAQSDEGHLAVAHFGMGAVWVFDAFGVPVLKVESPLGRGVTNLAFDPSDFSMLYITEVDSGSILRARLPMRGQAMYSHSDKS